MKAQFEEFWNVVALAPKTQHSLIATFLVPPVILLIGTIVVRDISFPEPLRSLSDPVRKAFLMSFFALSAASLVRFAALTYRHYIQDRRRLYGY
jgi:hypothetical protein